MYLWQTIVVIPLPYWLSLSLSLSPTFSCFFVFFSRADCLDGGFAFCPVEGCDNTFDVTYLTRVDLKGSLPQMVVNRVNQDAPLCVAVLRDKIQPLTQAFLQKKLEEERKKARKEQEKKERAEQLRIEDSNEKQNGVLLEKVNESNSATVPPAAQTDLPVSNGSGISGRDALLICLQFPCMRVI